MSPSRLTIFRAATIVAPVCKATLTRNRRSPCQMSSLQILLLGTLAGSTILLGLPLGRIAGASVGLRSALSATATGILLFLLYDVIHGGIEPVDQALERATNGGSWAHFFGFALLFGTGVTGGLMSLVYYDRWLKSKRDQAMLGPGAASAAEFE